MPPTSPAAEGHPPVPFDDHLEALSTSECLAYLRAGGLGRVAIVVGGMPVVLPVNFVLDGDDVLFMTGSGAKLRSATAGQPVAFEIDHLDEAGLGWSVLVIGEASATDEPAALGHARSLGLAPAAPGPHEHLVRITRRVMSGRRFGAPVERLHPRQP